MPDTAKRLYGPAQLPTTGVSLYTAPVYTIVKSIHIVNTQTVDLNYFFLHLNNGITDRSLFYGHPVSPTSTFDWSGWLVLNPSDRIWGQSSTASALTIMINGIEIS